MVPEVGTTLSCNQKRASYGFLLSSVEVVKLPLALYQSVEMIRLVAEYAEPPLVPLILM